jgi:hypothetical protein
MKRLWRWLTIALFLIAGMGISRVARAGKPTVTVVNNAPGMNTVHYSHPPTAGYVYTYVVQRQAPMADIWSTESPSGSVIDLNLQPNTSYSYRACQKVGSQLDCSDWNSVTTMAPDAGQLATGSLSLPNFTGSVVTPTSIRVMWNGGFPNEFYIARLNASSWYNQQDVKSGKEITFSNLTPDSDYSVMVKGCRNSFVSGSVCHPNWQALRIHTPALPLPPPPPPLVAGIIYPVNYTGEMFWYKHLDRKDGTFAWDGRSAVNPIGNGWYINFKFVFPGDDGVIYAVTYSGDLLWYKHVGRTDGTFSWAPGSGTVVGWGWNGFKSVFSGGDGHIYGLTPSGYLYWYRHTGRATGQPTWAAGSGAAPVGVGWHTFKQVFGAEGGVIYAVTYSGDLLWYRHEGRTSGTFDWAANSGARPIGGGFGKFLTVFSGGDGVIYGVTEAQDRVLSATGGIASPAVPGGNLLWYRHDGHTDGSFRWANNGTGTLVGNNWIFRHVIFGGKVPL